MAQGLCAMALRLLARPAARGFGENVSLRHSRGMLTVVSRGISSDLNRNVQSTGKSDGAPIQALESRPKKGQGLFSEGPKQVFKRRCYSQLSGSENVAISEESAAAATVATTFASDEELIQHVTDILTTTSPSELDSKLATLGDQVKAEHVPDILKRAYNSDLVFKFFDWVRANKQIKLEESVYHLMLHVLSLKERPQEMQWLLIEMHSNGYKLENSMFVWVMHSYARLKKVQDACRLFWKMEGLDCTPDISAYNAIMKILYESGNTHEFEMIHSSLKFSGTEFDATTYEIIFEKTCKTGKADDAYRLFQQMKMKFNPPVSAYHSLAACLKKSGQEQLAKDTLNNIPKDSK